MFKRKKFLILLLGLIALSFSSSWAAGLPEKEAKRKQALFLRGVKLWPSYCGNCHNPRAPQEHSPAEWDLLLMHMRARANLPPDVAEAILEYLKKR
ncbi:MAG: hypothetical protein IH857_02520 [Deltaproteobacteria bacterium]|nr:hypothetical protein [Deltaproteobacteria bacterium]